MSASDASAVRARAERVGAAQLARTRAYGKLIFFGEHFVVYKVPAIVGAVAAYTDCDVELCAAPGVTVVDERPAVPGYKAEKAAEGEAAVAIVLRHLGVDPAAEGLRITFGGTLTAVSGIGASAAQVVSLARAVGLAKQLRLTDDDVNAAGFEGERGYHGTPSGIDNTAATFGGLLRFQRTDGAPIMVRKALRAPLRIVFASTGITASTTAVVGDVRRKKDADPAWFDALLAAYVALAARGEAAIESGDMAALGAAFVRNAQSFSRHLMPFHHADQALQSEEDRPLSASLADLPESDTDGVRHVAGAVPVAEGQVLDSDAVAAQRLLFHHQHPRECKGKRFVVFTFDRAYWGFAANMNFLTVIFNYAIKTNRIVVTANPDNWNYAGLDCRWGTRMGC